MQARSLFSAFFVGYGLLQMPSGILVDELSLKEVMAFTILTSMGFLTTLYIFWGGDHKGARRIVVLSSLFCGSRSVIPLTNDGPQAIIYATSKTVDWKG